ncbi:hypothetical protein KU6B_48610 [Mameliella alba]|uniref:hypothetical protein n=1 Tax=Mameliella alba TaxID=561184 RepID=UPI0013E47872|nr:hypothetical protein [Mameliella alba]BBU58596.1 hypothetical protein KU6B_48610 [Mameliella alba]
MGLRWILRQAARVDATAPVIVNVSLGVLAGPKDGTHFVEHQMAREAQTWEEVTGQPVRLVWAFGNSYRSSQVAWLTPTEAPRNLTGACSPTTKPPVLSRSIVEAVHLPTCRLA